MTIIRFTREHEYVRVEETVGTVGITDYAQQQLGDVVFVELPAVGTQVKQGEQAAVVESVKAASEVYAPVSGEIVAVNDELTEDAARVNADPLGAGWFFKVRIENSGELDSLMNLAAYETYIEDLH